MAYRFLYSVRTVQQILKGGPKPHVGHFFLHPPPAHLSFPWPVFRWILGEFLAVIFHPWPTSLPLSYKILLVCAVFGVEPSLFPTAPLHCWGSPHLLEWSCRKSSLLCHWSLYLDVSKASCAHSWGFGRWLTVGALQLPGKWWVTGCVTWKIMSPFLALSWLSSHTHLSSPSTMLFLLGSWPKKKQPKQPLLL